MKSKFLLTLLLLVGLTTYVFSQNVAVSGTVTDNNGGGLPGVNVIEKGTANGVATDVNGKFSLSVPNGATLIFSFVGFQSREVKVEGGQTDLGNIKMAEEGSLTEVVVTALGVKQSKDETGSSVTQVATKSLVRSGEPQLLNQLSGKAAGVQVISSSGSDPGAGAKIQIRGANSISGNNQPLFVIDGIPMYNTTDQAGSGAGGTAGVVQQSRLNDINPNDIKSMEILKGASAAALYGARAANGVVLITTKSGQASQKGYSISINSSVSIDQVNRMVPLQTAYGQGAIGTFINGTSLSWGDRISDRPGGANAYITDPTATGYAGSFAANNGQTYYALASGTATEPYGGKRSRDTYSTIDEIFGTGVTWNNNISVSSADQKGNFFASFSDTRQKGVIKNNSDFRRTTARLNATRYLGKLFTISARSTFAHSVANAVQRGSNTSGLLLAGLRTPTDFDVTGFTGTYTDAAGLAYVDRQRAYRNPLGANTSSIYDNPLWLTQNVKSPNTVDRFIGSLEFGADPLPWLNITWRMGMDHFSDIRGNFFPTISATNQGGLYSVDNIRNTQFNTDLIARASFKANENISGTFLVGVGANQRKRSRNSNSVSTFVNSLSPPQLANSISAGRNPFSVYTNIRNIGYYSQASLNLYKMVFVNLGGRYEEWSSMSEGFFYPTADLAFQFSKLIPKNDIFTFGKARVAWGQVGRAAPAYSDLSLFFANATIFDAGWGSSLDPAAYGGSTSQSNTAPSPLTPEIKTEVEFGIDARFFKDRLSASVTYYNNNTKDVIQSIPVSNPTGFTQRVANSAELENKGLEIELSGDVIRKGDFTWSLNANYSRNINTVKTLVGTNRLFLNGFTGTSSSAVVGYPLGALWGTTWQTNADGSYILDENNFPQATEAPQYLGDPNAEFRLGFGSTFRYKNISLSIFVDHSAGGEIWNGTKGALYFFGRHEDQAHTTTLTAAEASTLKIFGGTTVSDWIAAGGYPSANVASDGSVTIRGKKANFGGGEVFLDEIWYRSGPGSGFTGPSGQFVEDATWTRLREVTLSYNLNSKGFKNATGFQSAQFTITGRNLFLWTNYSGIDPDTNLTGASGSGFGLDYFNNPSTRSFLFSIKVTY